MDCKKAETDLIDHFYKELGDEKTALIQDHLDNCPSCQALYQKMSGVLSVVAIPAETTVNDFIATRIIAKLEKEKAVRMRGRMIQNVLRPVMVAGLVALGIFTGIKISDGFTDNLSNSVLASENNSLATEYASENYLISTNDELMELYLNENK